MSNPNDAAAPFDSYPTADSEFTSQAFGRLYRLALAVLLTTLAATAACTQSLPDEVEKAIFQADQFVQPITISLPSVTERRTLDAFRNARTSSWLSPIAPAGKVDRGDNRIRLYCALHWITLESVTTREGITFDYAVASPELEKLGQQRSVPIAQRKLKSIDYRNKYKVNPMGMGEREVFAVTFSYTLESSLPALQSPSTVFKGKATAQLDPEDGEWKLEEITLSDEGEQEFYKTLSAQSPAGCEAPSGTPDPGQEADQPSGHLSPSSTGTPEAGVAPANGSLLGPISDPIIAAHLTRQIRMTSEDPHPIVVVNLEGDKAWINLNGTNVDLPIAELEGDPENGEVGSKFSRKFTKDNVSLLVKYELLSSYVIGDLGCTRTEYRVVIEISNGRTMQIITPESYGEGC